MDSGILNTINALGWHKYDINLKIGHLRREQAILEENSQNIIDQISESIRASVRRHNTGKDLYISKLEGKIEQLNKLINECKDLRNSGKSLQDDENLAVIIDQIDKGLYTQLMKRLENEKPTGDNFLDDCAECMIKELEATYAIVDEEYNEIKENPVNSMMNMLMQKDADVRDIALRQRQFYQIQEWKNQVVLKGFDKNDEMKVAIPTTPVGFYSVRDGAKLYVIGGKFNNFRISGTMTKYDLKNSEHKDIIPMRVARFYHSATVTREINSEGIWRSKIVIVGGQNPEMPPYDISGGNEERLSSIKEKEEESKGDIRKSNPDGLLRLTSKGSSGVNSVIQTIISNMKKDGPILRQCEIYDPDRNKCKSTAVLNFGRKKCGICSFGSVVYAICGYGERAGVSEAQVKTSYTFISTIERIDLKRYDATDEQTWWKVVNVLYEPYVDIGAYVTHDQRILLFGGRDTMQEQTKITEIVDGYFTGDENDCKKKELYPSLDRRICFPNMASFVMNTHNKTLYALNMFGQQISHQIETE